MMNIPGLLSDEEKQSINQGAMLNAALALIGNRSGRGLAGAANAALGGLGAYGQAQTAGLNDVLRGRTLVEEMALKKELKTTSGMTLEDAKKRAELYMRYNRPDLAEKALASVAQIAGLQQQEALQTWRNNLQDPSFKSGQAALASGGAGPTVSAASNVQADPKDQMLFNLAKQGLIDPSAYLTAITKDNTPIKVGDGEVLIDPRTRKPIFENPKADKTPSSYQEWVLAGRPGTFDQWLISQKQAGATKISVPVQAGKSLASEIGGIVTDARTKAMAAIDQAGAANTILTNVDKAFTGPGATAKLTGAQIADAFGFGGKDTTEKIANTRQTMQGLAQLVLAGRQQMRGQGAITESEGKLAERAMAGDINLTAGELKVLANAARRSARYQYDGYQTQLGAMRGNPELAPLMPFYGVPAFPEIEQPPIMRQPGSSNIVDFGSLK